MIEEVQKHYPGQDDNVKNLVSGMFNSIIGIGMFTGPLLGAFFTKEYGFRLCGDIMGFIFIAFGIIYFVLGDGVKQFRKSSWSKKASSKQVWKQDHSDALIGSNDNEKWLLKEESNLKDNNSTNNDDEKTIN